MQQNPITLLRESSPYIHRHHNHIFVIAFAGEVIEQAYFRRLIQDIAIVKSLGAKVVLVHGTRPQIEERLTQAGHSALFHNNVRITDQKALNAVQEACGYTRIQIEHLLTSALNQPLIKTRGLSVISGNFISAKPLGILDGVDYKNTGQIRRIHFNSIQQQLEQQNIVLISPIGYSPSGESYNLSYEETALATASALNAKKLIFICNQALTLPSALTQQEAATIGLTNPLLALISNAVGQNIERVHLLDGNQDGALLLELYTRDGIGCMIATEHFEQTRVARIDDIVGLLELIRPLEERGVLVKRSREQLELDIANYHIIEVDQQIIGCAALYHTDDVELAELACFIIHNQYRSANRGTQLLTYMEGIAKQTGKKRLLALTTQTSDWFKEQGFQESSIDDLPDNKKRLYNYKRNSRVLIKHLD